MVDTRLLEEEVDPDPLVQFERWFEAARAAGEPQPDAMALATASTGGRPAVRTVLLKAFDARGLVFYTSYESAKGRDLRANPRAAFDFFWYRVHRQVRGEGRVDRVSHAESEAYFRSRPAGARLSAAASPQSQVVTRQRLEEEVRRLGDITAGSVKRPPNWGGFRIRPRTMEFWQGRPDRLHDRLRYSRVGSGWRIERLAP